MAVVVKQQDLFLEEPGVGRRATQTLNVTIPAQ